MFISKKSLVSLLAADLRQVQEEQKEASASESLCCKKKNSFLLKVRLLAVLQMSLLIRKVLRSWVRDEVVMVAVMPQFSMGDTNNTFIVYMYRLSAFGILIIV